MKIEALNLIENRLRVSMSKIYLNPTDLKNKWPKQNFEGYNEVFLL